jgi:AraC-like DNA-binding protein
LARKSPQQRSGVAGRSALSLFAAVSRLFVRGIAQAIAIHLAGNYTALTEAMRGETSSLPGFKLRRVTRWMAEYMAEEFSLARLAEQAGVSEYHFNGLFKRATSVPPLQYQIRLRQDTARRLLSETKECDHHRNDVGYATPSHSRSSSAKKRVFRSRTTGGNGSLVDRTLKYQNAAPSVNLVRVSPYTKLHSKI